MQTNKSMSDAGWRFFLLLDSLRWSLGSVDWLPGYDTESIATFAENTASYFGYVNGGGQYAKQ